MRITNAGPARLLARGTLVVSVVLALLATAITVATEPSHLIFTVDDDGTGFDIATTGHGTGLQGMAGRLAALNGSLDVQSAPGEGTRVVGAIPLEIRAPMTERTTGALEAIS